MPLLQKGSFVFRICLLLYSILSFTHLATSYEEFVPLNCVACDAGFYLSIDTLNCTQCPVGSTTFNFSNASDISDCICTYGYENLSTATYACSACNLNFYKNQIRNNSCVRCPANSLTTETAAESIAACVCDVGFSDILDSNECSSCAAGSYKDFVGDIACLSCPEDHYCPQQSVTPIACPANSSSSAQSTVIEDCFCHAGFHYSYTGVNSSYHCVGCAAGKYSDVANSAECLDCPANTFNPNVFGNDIIACEACPLHAQSAAGSAKIQNCFCDLGYAGAPGETCVACTPGFFRENSSKYICDACPESTYNAEFASISVQSCLSCQQNTTSRAGSGSQQLCVCDPGFFGVLTHDEFEQTIYECILCDAGKYSNRKNSTVCTECGIGKFSQSVGATSQTTCVECANGKFSYVTGATFCNLCPNSTYTNASSDTPQICNACPTFSSHNLLGSTDVFDCVCQPAYYKSEYGEGVARSFTCKLCLPGHYCPGQDVIIPCAGTSFSFAGQTVCSDCSLFSQATANASLTNADQCQCVQGAFGSFHNNCTLCTEGKFQPFDYTYDGVHAQQADLQRVFTGALIGAPNALQVQCIDCAFATFQNQSGASVCYNCPENSNTSNVASSRRTQCICNPSYVGLNGGHCSLCSANNFCPGGTISTPCRTHSVSAAGSSSQADCNCVPGFYSEQDDSVCLQCPANSYCTGNLHVTSCPLNSHSAPGSSRVSQCTCNDGHWRGCTITSNGLYKDNFGADCTINFTLPCTLCGENDVCFNNTLLHCAENSAAPAGSNDARDCVCNAGYRAQYF